MECKNCKFWYAIDWVQNVAIKGQCRIYSPEIYVMGFVKKRRQSAWPTTRDEHWCGEFKGREEE